MTPRVVSPLKIQYFGSHQNQSSQKLSYFATKETYFFF